MRKVRVRVAGQWQTLSGTLANATPPAAPINLQVSQVGSTVTASWQAPLQIGGSAVTGYVITVTPGGQTQTLSSSTLQAVFSSLGTGNYTFEVYATNATGNGAVGRLTTSLGDLSTIDPTGTENVSQRIQDYILSHPAGSTVAFAAGATYRIDQTLTIAEKSDLIIDGNGAQFFTDDPTGDGSTLEAPSKAARTRAHFRLRDCSNITLKNIHVRGAHPNGGLDSSAYVEPLEAQHGFDIIGSTGVTVEDCSATDVYGDFIYFGHGSGPCHDITIRRFYGARNGRQGVASVSSYNVLITDSEFTDVRRSMIDLEPNFAYQEIHDFEVSDCILGSHRLSFFASKGAAAPISNVRVLRNTVNSAMNSTIGIPGVRRSNWRFENNIANQGYGSTLACCLNVTGVDGFIFKNNVQPLQANRNMVIVQTTDCTSVEVSGNSYPGGVGEWRNV
jgi:hypothetical protein